jgi:hypothetical protein
LKRIWYNFTAYTSADKVLDRMVEMPKRSMVPYDCYLEETGIRSWPKEWQHLAYQETLTDCLRVALGHLVLNEMNSRYESYNEEELIKFAHRGFIQRGFHKTFFREKR